MSVKLENGYEKNLEIAKQFSEQVDQLGKMLYPGDKCYSVEQIGQQYDSLVANKSKIEAIFRAQGGTAGSALQIFSNHEKEYKKSILPKRIAHASPKKDPVSPVETVRHTPSAVKIREELEALEGVLQRIEALRQQIAAENAQLLASPLTIHTTTKV